MSELALGAVVALGSSMVTLGIKEVIDASKRSALWAREDQTRFHDARKSAYSTFMAAAFRAQRATIDARASGEDGERTAGERRDEMRFEAEAAKIVASRTVAEAIDLLDQATWLYDWADSLSSIRSVGWDMWSTCRDGCRQLMQQELGIAPGEGDPAVVTSMRASIDDVKEILGISD